MSKKKQFHRQIKLKRLKFIQATIIERTEQWKNEKTEITIKL